MNGTDNNFQPKCNTRLFYPITVSIQIAPEKERWRYLMLCLLMLSISVKGYTHTGTNETAGRHSFAFAEYFRPLVSSVARQASWNSDVWSTYLENVTARSLYLKIINENSCKNFLDAIIYALLFVIRVVYAFNFVQCMFDVLLLWTVLTWFLFWLCCTIFGVDVKLLM